MFYLLYFYFSFTIFGLPTVREALSKAWIFLLVGLGQGFVLPLDWFPEGIWQVVKSSS